MAVSHTVCQNALKVELGFLPFTILGYGLCSSEELNCVCDLTSLWWWKRVPHKLLIIIIIIIIIIFIIVILTLLIKKLKKNNEETATPDIIRSNIAVHCLILLFSLAIVPMDIVSVVSKQLYLTTSDKFYLFNVQTDGPSHATLQNCGMMMTMMMMIVIIVILLFYYFYFYYWSSWLRDPGIQDTLLFNIKLVLVIVRYSLPRSCRS